MPVSFGRKAGREKEHAGLDQKRYGGTEARTVGQGLEANLHGAQVIAFCVFGFDDDFGSGIHRCDSSGIASRRGR